MPGAPLTSAVTRHGFDEVRRMFEKHEDFGRVIGHAMLEGARLILVPPIKVAAPVGRDSKHGELKRGIGAFSIATLAATRAAQGKVISPVRVGPASKDFWYAKWVVRGTKPHVIRARGLSGRDIRSINKSGHALRSFKRGSHALRFGGHLVPVVFHPGAKPNPFLHAADAQEKRYIEYTIDKFVVILQA